MSAVEEKTREQNKIAFVDFRWSVEGWDQVGNTTSHGIVTMCQSCSDSPLVNLCVETTRTCRILVQTHIQALHLSTREY